MMRPLYYVVSALSLLSVFALHFIWPQALFLLVIIIPYICLGIYDIYFTSHNVLINYLVIDHIRYIVEFIQPEVQ